MGGMVNLSAVAALFGEERIIRSLRGGCGGFGELLGQERIVVFS